MSALTGIDQTVKRVVGDGMALWVEAVYGQLAIALGWSDAWSVSSGVRLRENLHASRMRHADMIVPQEGGALRTFVIDLVETAQEDAGKQLSGESLLAVHRYAEEMIAALGEGIRLIMRGDEIVASNLMRNLQIKASLFAARRIAPNIAMNMVKVGALQTLKLTSVDSIGRRWNSTLMCRLDARKALMDIYNHTFMSTLLDQGTEIAAIGHSDGSVVFSITGATPGTPKLDDVEKYMHPNARHLVTRA